MKTAPVMLIAIIIITIISIAQLYSGVQSIDSYRGRQTTVIEQIFDKK